MITDQRARATVTDQRARATASQGKTVKGRKVYRVERWVTALGEWAVLPMFFTELQGAEDRVRKLNRRDGAGCYRVQP